MPGHRELRKCNKTTRVAQPAPNYFAHRAGFVTRSKYDTGERTQQTHYEITLSMGANVMQRARRTRSRSRDGRQGFTLMEVLLVLAILVILGTFAVTNFSKVFAGAKIKAAQSQLNEFKTPLSIYQMDIGTYPDNNTGLQALRAAPADLADGSKWGGPYLSSEIPKDPWENDYQYEQLSPDAYKVFSAGPDGQAGTEDDIIATVGE